MRLLDSQIRQVLRSILNIERRIKFGVALELLGIGRHVRNLLLDFVLADDLGTENFFLEPIDSLVNVGSPTVSIIVFLGRYLLKMDHRCSFVATLDRRGLAFRHQGISAFWFVFESDHQ